MNAKRYEYVLDLKRNRLPPVIREDIVFRHPVSGDAELLGKLMLDSYQGTIDYEGETLLEAQEEMATSLNGKYGEPLNDCSWMAFARTDLVAACLVVRWQGEHCAFVTFVMTASQWKGRGLATTALQASLTSISLAGFQEVRAVITAGNSTSEQLFLRAGFIVVLEINPL
ncbi:GNAT family N-acetyltransferase [bacterium]|nr:GNAT family N-acetyltransferase [bacterium]